MCRDEDNPLAVTEAENWQNCGLFTHLQTAAKAGTEFKQETKEEQKDWPSTEQPNQEAAASAPWRRPTGVKNIDSSHEDQEMEAGAEEEAAAEVEVEAEAEADCIPRTAGARAQGPVSSIPRVQGNQTQRTGGRPSHAGVRRSDDP